VPTDALDADTHALAGNRAAYEDDLALVPAQHASSGDRLVDGQNDFRTWRKHRNGL
jgi:hypothetical protein